MNSFVKSALVASLLLASCVAGCQEPTSPPPEKTFAYRPATMEGVVVPTTQEEQQLAAQNSNPTTAASTQPVDPDAVLAKLPAVESPAPVKPVVKTSDAPSVRETPTSSTPAPSTPAPSAPAPSPQTPAAKDTDSAKPIGELMQNKSAMIAYGAEVYRIVNRDDEIISVLRSGATVIAKRVKSPVLAVRAYTYTGGVYEGKWLGGGLSHLLEHLVAGGTNGRRSEEQNRDLLQKLGNDSNAYTTDDHTCFYVNTTPDNLDAAVDLVTGWMLTATITPAEYRREYQVVQRELEMYKGDADSVFAQLTINNRYRVSPARVPIIGYQEVIQGLSRDDVYTYYRLAYQPNNLVFAIAGDQDPEVMLAALQKHLADAKPGREFSRDISPEPPVLAPRTLVATFPNLGQAKLDLAFPSVKLQTDDLYALDLLSTILGGGESSVLVEEIRDKRQLVSGISTSNETPNYVEGTFGISLQLDVDKIHEATDAVLAELDKIKSDGVDPDRIARAKIQMKTARIKGNQKCEDILANIATDFMSTGDPHFGERYLEQISRVTPEQIKQVANKYFDRQKLLTTALLPAESPLAAKLPKAEELLRAAAAGKVASATQPATDSAADSAVDSNVTRVELENGTVLLHKRVTTTPLVEIRLLAAGGVTAEGPRSNGLGNLTMQLLTRGTKTRSARQIAEFFDSTGGEIDASCGLNSWSVSATCLRDDFAKTLDVFADIVNNPVFPDAELAAEKDRIADEIDSQDSSWDAEAIRFFNQTYFGPSKSPYQFSPIGTREVVATFTADDVKSWYTQKVLAAPRVIAIYGDVELKDAQTFVATQFGGGAKALVKKVEPNLPPQPAPNSRAGINVEQYVVKKTDKALAGVVIGFNARSVSGDPANPAFTVAQTLTSGYGYPTGYLFDTLRGRGLVYVVAASNVIGKGVEMPGTFRVYAGCEPDKVNEVVSLILLNIARLQGSDADIQQKWFDRAKTLITTSDAMDDETPGAQASRAARDELAGLGYDYHQTFRDRIRAVTMADVQNLARTRLRDCVITVSTPDPDSINRTPGLRVYDKFPPVDLTPKGPGHSTGK